MSFLLLIKTATRIAYDCQLCEAFDSDQYQWRMAQNTP